MKLYEKFSATFQIVDDTVFTDGDGKKDEVALIENFLIPLIIGKIALSIESFDYLRKLCAAQDDIRELVYGEWEDGGCDCLKCQVLRKLNNNAEFRMATNIYLKKLEETE